MVAVALYARSPEGVLQRVATYGIVVEDRGPGIEPADQLRIFENFERAAAHDHSGSLGLGLGLYITKELVVAHRGTIDVASAPGRGAAFTVTLPRAPEYRAD